MTTAVVISSILFYVFMMFFSWIIVGIGRAGGRRRRPGDAFLMIAFWPAWVLMEARRGDPFLIGASVTFIAFAAIYGVMLVN